MTATASASAATLLGKDLLKTCDALTYPTREVEEAVEGGRNVFPPQVPPADPYAHRTWGLVSPLNGLESCAALRTALLSDVAHQFKTNADPYCSPGLVLTIVGLALLETTTSTSLARDLLEQMLRDRAPTGRLRVSNRWCFDGRFAFLLIHTHRVTAPDQLGRWCEVAVRCFQLALLCQLPRGIVDELLEPTTTSSPSYALRAIQTDQLHSPTHPVAVALGQMIPGWCPSEALKQELLAVLRKETTSTADYRSWTTVLLNAKDSAGPREGPSDCGVERMPADAVAFICPQTGKTEYRFRMFFEREAKYPCSESEYAKWMQVKTERQLHFKSVLAVMDVLVVTPSKMPEAEQSQAPAAAAKAKGQKRSRFKKGDNRWLYRQPPTDDYERAKQMLEAPVTPTRPEDEYTAMKAALNSSTPAPPKKPSKPPKRRRTDEATLTAAAPAPAPAPPPPPPRPAAAPAVAGVPAPLQGPTIVPPLAPQGREHWRNANDPPGPLGQELVHRPVDEFGRTFVLNPVTTETLDLAEAMRSADPYMLNLWDARSLIRDRLNVQGAPWKDVSPLPRPDGVDRLSVNDCLTIHLLGRGGHIQDPITAVIRPEIIPILDSYYSALTATGPITTHRELLRIPGMRFYFIDMVRSRLLDTKHALTVKSMAFLATALVYCMDSHEPRDREEYSSIHTLIKHLTEHIPLPAMLNGRACRFPGQTLATLHPTTAGANDGAEGWLAPTGVGPRLLRWLMRSQRQLPTEEDENWGCDRYECDTVLPIQGLRRKVEIALVVSALLSLYFYGLMRPYAPRGLSMYHVLNSMLPIDTFNAMTQTLRKRLIAAGLNAEHAVQQYPLRHHTSSAPNGLKPHLLWPGLPETEELRNLQNDARRTLVAFIGSCYGSDDRRETRIRFVEGLDDLAERVAPTEDPQRKYPLITFATYLAAAVKHLQKQKYDVYSVAVPQDYVRTKRTQSYKIVFECGISQKTFHFGSSATEEDRAHRDALINEKVRMHECLYRLHVIQRVAESLQMVDPANDRNLTEVQRQQWHRLPKGGPFSFATSAGVSRPPRPEQKLPAFGPEGSAVPDTERGLLTKRVGRIMGVPPMLSSLIGAPALGKAPSPQDGLRGDVASSGRDHCWHANGPPPDPAGGASGERGLLIGAPSPSKGPFLPEAPAVGANPPGSLDFPPLLPPDLNVDSYLTSPILYHTSFAPAGQTSTPGGGAPAVEANPLVTVSTVDVNQLLYGGPGPLE
jgi:hypothetical protein